MVSSSAVPIPKITPVKKGHWNRVTLFIFHQNMFFVSSFALFYVYLLLRDVGQNLYVRALRLLGKIFNLPKIRGGRASLLIMLTVLNRLRN